jgi:hypothetical protein
VFLCERYTECRKIGNECISRGRYDTPKTVNISTIADHLKNYDMRNNYLTKTAWPQSASELYRPSDRCLSAKLVPTFCGQRDKSLRPYSRISRPEQLLFLPSSSSVALTRLSGPRSKPTTFFVVPGIEPRICSQKLLPLDHRGGRNNDLI